MPIERELIAAEATHVAALRRAREEIAVATGRKNPTKAMAGRASGAVRQGTKRRIRDDYARAISKGSKPHIAKATVAQAAGVTKTTVRRVVRKK